MKLITKNGLSFAAGMFWQIADEGKRSINLAKLIKDTQHNRFCYIKRIATWGFCHKDELGGQRKIASLGKFIIESSKLSNQYANCIICFKFKSFGEMDEGRILDHDLYGYIVLLNGTICPDEGEYVAKIEMVVQSIYEIASKYDIETLYLPVEVSSQFLNVFEILSDSYSDKELLTKIMLNLSKQQVRDLEDFITANFYDDKGYIEVIHNILLTMNLSTRLNTGNINDANKLNITSGYKHVRSIDGKCADATTAHFVDIEKVCSLIREAAFEKCLKSKMVRTEKSLNYLIPNIIILPYTSDEIYWSNANFKKNHAKSLIYPILNKTLKKYKIALSLSLIVVLGYLIFQYFVEDKSVKVRRNIKAATLYPSLVSPKQLISACLLNKDKYFKDLGQWTLLSLKCNSLGSVFTFSSAIDTTLANFTDLIDEDLSGKNSRDKVRVHYANKIGVYTEDFKNVLPNQNGLLLSQGIARNNVKNSLSTPNRMLNNSMPKFKAEQEAIINRLQQAVISYSIKTVLPSIKNGLLGQQHKKTGQLIKFKIISRQSPLFLYKVHVLDDMYLREISMTFDQNSGSYEWIIQGEF